MWRVVNTAAYGLAPSSVESRRPSVPVVVRRRVLVRSRSGFRRSPNRGLATPFGDLAISIGVTSEVSPRKRFLFRRSDPFPKNRLVCERYVRRRISDRGSGSEEPWSHARFGTCSEPMCPSAHGPGPGESTEVVSAWSRARPSMRTPGRFSLASAMPFSRESLSRHPSALLDP